MRYWHIVDKKNK